MRTSDTSASRNETPRSLVILVWIVGFAATWQILHGLTGGPFWGGEFAGIGGVLFGLIYAFASALGGTVLSFVVAMVGTRRLAARWRRHAI